MNSQRMLRDSSKERVSFADNWRDQSLKPEDYPAHYTCDILPPHQSTFLTIVFSAVPSPHYSCPGSYCWLLLQNLRSHIIGAKEPITLHGLHAEYDQCNSGATRNPNASEGFSPTELLYTSYLIRQSIVTLYNFFSPALDVLAKIV